MLLGRRDNLVRKMLATQTGEQGFCKPSIHVKPGETAPSINSVLLRTDLEGNAQNLRKLLASQPGAQSSEHWRDLDSNRLRLDTWGGSLASMHAAWHIHTPHKYICTERSLQYGPLRGLYHKSVQRIHLAFATFNALFGIFKSTPFSPHLFFMLILLK